MALSIAIQAADANTLYNARRTEIGFAGAPFALYNGREGILKTTILKFTGFALAVAFAAAALHPDTRKAVLAMVNKKQRVILAVTNAALDNTGEEFQILKVKTDEGLFIEVYGSIKDKNLVFNKLLSSAKLPDKRDGYFTYNGQVTNLAVDNIDNDHSKEILATSFDSNMVAHLNIYRFIKGQSQLQLVELK